MGKTLIISLLLVSGMAVGAVAHELPMGPPDDFPPPPPPGCHPHPPLSARDHHWPGPMPQMSRIQKDQLDQLLQKEHDYVAGVMKKMEESRIALRQAADREPFDEAAVTALAKTHAELQTELMLSHLRTKARIKAFFSPAPNNKP